MRQAGCPSRGASPPRVRPRTRLGAPYGAAGPLVSTVSLEPRHVCALPPAADLTTSTARPRSQAAFSASRAVAPGTKRRTYAQRPQEDSWLSRAPSISTRHAAPRRPWRRSTGFRSGDGRRGPEYAERFLRYDPLALARIPPFAVESFAGVGNPLRMGPLAAGATVVDIGCGSATDLLLAANAVGPRGRAIGVDMTEAMLGKAEAAAAEAGLANVELRRGDALELPIESVSADFVISNGVLNLAPDKRRAFSEVLRVLRPGGRFLRHGKPQAVRHDAPRAQRNPHAAAHVPHRGLDGRPRRQRPRATHSRRA